MKRFLTIRRLSFIFFSLFAVTLAGVFILQRFWVDPGDRCTAKGYWYDMETRICAQPVYIPDITKRPEGMTRAEASAEANRDLVKLEDQIAADKRARAAATEAERERVKALQGR
ncbi:hypothetical protein NI456_12945 [Brevundimonas diminuta]|uniref:hypothetical protein n=1 Tax=Brevundimonas TaxID=41275 RepID=UPI0002A3465B|nr:MULTISPECIES: hypothetical protein [Brevundimonas]EKY28034.1 hypothetical protein HMPREF0185_01845 [Brevundimonas diminuta 470-4]HAC00455.1 hypothetical protein [Brevundimonas sp.]MCO8019764.1 hypothetical protein [Brevundimonas diminuta]MCO8023039.1 hypothetical protein [Brevundimonas diminuta]HAL08233.1 hypothetical protein [Brevundimonas sp.]